MSDGYDIPIRYVGGPRDGEEADACDVLAGLVMPDGSGVYVIDGLGRDGFVRYRWQQYPVPAGHSAGRHECWRLPGARPCGLWCGHDGPCVVWVPGWYLGDWEAA